MLSSDLGLRTLHDYGLDGHAPLRAIVEASGYGSVAQLVASLSLFSHPETVRATGCRPAVRIIRNAARRGEIVEMVGRRVGLDDKRPRPTPSFGATGSSILRGPARALPRCRLIPSRPGTAA